MKKILSLAFIVTATVASSFGQELFLRLGLGYAFPQAGQSMYDTPIPYNGFPTGYNGSRNNTTSTETYNIKGASFSAGFQGILGLGYMFNNNVGVQLDGAIGLSPAKYTFNDNNVNLNTVASPLPGTISTIQRAKGPFILMPSLVLQTGGNPWCIYTRLGLALPLNTKITQDQVISNAPGTGAVTTDDFTWQITNSFSLGFTAAAGLKYKINDRVSIWGEVSILSMSVYAKEQDLKTWVETDPVNGPQSYPVSSYPNAPNIKFSKTATVDSSLSNIPTYAQPFSNVGVNFGVVFTLSKHEKRSRSSDIDGDTKKPYRRR